MIILIIVSGLVQWNCPYHLALQSQTSQIVHLQVAYSYSIPQLGAQGLCALVSLASMHLLLHRRSPGQQDCVVMLSLNVPNTPRGPSLRTVSIRTRAMSERNQGARPTVLALSMLVLYCFNLCTKPHGCTILNIKGLNFNIIMITIIVIINFTSQNYDTLLNKKVYIVLKNLFGQLVLHNNDNIQ